MDNFKSKFRKYRNSGLFIAAIVILTVLFVGTVQYTNHRTKFEFLEAYSRSQRREAESFARLIQSGFSEIIQKASLRIAVREGKPGDNLEDYVYPLFTGNTAVRSLHLMTGSGAVLEGRSCEVTRGTGFTAQVPPPPGTLPRTGSVDIGIHGDLLILWAHSGTPDRYFVFTVSLPALFAQYVNPYGDHAPDNIFVQFPDSTVASSDAMVATVPLPLGPAVFHVVVQTPISLITEPLDHLRNQTLAMTVVFVLAGIVIVTIFARISAKRHRDSEEALTRIVQERTTELEAAVFTRDRFLSIVSHDLRGPLGGIAQMLVFVDENRDDFTGDNLFEIISELRISANSIWQLAENLLQWTRARQDRLSVNPAEYDLRGLFEALMPMYERLAEEKEISFVYPGEETHTVFADRHMVETILRNLLGNAIKFTQDRGSVTVSTESSGGFVRLCVTDTGVGMSAETIREIESDAFPKSTYGTRGEKGTGLGLELVKELVQKNGGSLTFTSEPGKGTVICFTLPEIAPVEELPD